MKIYISKKEAHMVQEAIRELETNMFEQDFGDGEHGYSLSEVKALENIKSKLLKHSDERRSSNIPEADVSTFASAAATGTRSTRRGIRSLGAN